MNGHLYEIDARYVVAGQWVLATPTDVQNPRWRKVVKVEDCPPGGMYSVGCTHVYYSDGPGHVFTLTPYGRTLTTYDPHGIAA